VELLPKMRESPLNRGDDRLRVRAKRRSTAAPEAVPPGGDGPQFGKGLFAPGPPTTIVE
jgi:hypothetical protein